MSARYFGPRRLTCKESTAILAMPASEIKKLREAMIRGGTEIYRIQQVTTLMQRRADYERAVPANHGRSTIDR
jgi:hypothetical protein